jgi:hypothetical protein
MLNQTICKIFFLIFFINGSLFASSDSLAKMRSVHAELAGTGGIYSVFYEQRFCKTKLLLHTGFSCYGTGKRTLFVFPVLVKKTFGNSNHRIETGIGNTITISIRQGFQIFPRALLLLGWRFQKNESPWIFRIAYTPMISYIADLQYQHWAGISIGYTLKTKK